MTTLKIARYAAWGLLVALVVATAWLLWTGRSAVTGGQEPIALGGPFTLTDMDGQPATEKMFDGKAHAIFFGYTHCPDVCPTTLADLSQRITELGPDAGKILFVFVTVDPERDTPEIMKNYLSSFPGQFVGLSGTPTEIDQIVAEYKIYRKKVPGADGDYTMDHTAGVFLFDRSNKFRGVIDFQEDGPSALKKLKRIAES